MTKKKEDRRIRRSRKLLQDALIHLLRRKLLAKIQIKEIVNQADVSRTTFYQHFETKEQLLFSLIEDLFDNINTAVFHHDAIKEEPLDIVKLLTFSYEQWLLYSEELKWVLQIENKDLLIDSLKPHIKLLRNAVDQHFSPSNTVQAYADYEISFVAGGLYMLIKDWIKNGMQESPETMGKITFLLLDNGLAPHRTLQATQPDSTSSQTNNWQLILASLEEEASQTSTS